MSSWWSQFWKAALRVRPPLTADDGKAVSPDSNGLRRRLGLLDLVLLGIGASIGAGIFVVTGTVARDAGPGVTLSFVIAGLACVLNALCYAELSTSFPAIVGGAYLYSYSGFNELVAFLVFCQLMLDYHIGAASIARSLASYLINILELIPVLKGRLPKWLGPGGKVLLDGFFSINVVAPLLLLLLTVILCQGVRESATFNSVITLTKVLIVLIVVAVGSFEVDTANWTPFAPNGMTAIVTGATVVFFAYVGFDAVANSAEESKKPKRDLPIGILVSLLACAALYVCVCLVITGMVPYEYLGGDAPLAVAFFDRGLKFMTVLISVGAVAGLTTTLLVGLYVQSRLYLGLGRDGLLPSLLSNIHPKSHTPVVAQIWCGLVASILATFFDVSRLSHILSVGALSGYSVVCACVIVLHVKQEGRVELNFFTKSREAVFCLCGVAFCGFIVGLCFRFSTHFMYPTGILAITILISIPVYIRQEYGGSHHFCCSWIPTIPLLGILFNMFLFAQLHWEAWVRFFVLGALAVIFYALYGQHHAKHGTFVSEDVDLYERVSMVDDYGAYGES